MSNDYLDIKIFFSLDQHGEWGDVVVEYGDLVIEDGFETAILISLLSDAYIKEPGKQFKEKRGWWAEKIFNFEHGSKWWLLERSKITKQTLRLMEQYAKNALQWMIDDGIAEKISCLAVKATDQNNRVYFYLVVYRQDEEPYKKRFEFNWLNQIGS